MRDLSDVMNDEVETRERWIAELSPSPAALAGAVRTVRRRRAVRHTVQALGVSAVAVAVAGASWLGLRTDEPVPAHTPSPTVTPTVTPTTTPTPTAAPVVLDEVAGLPPTRA